MPVAVIKKRQGFTLIEIVVGIVTLAVAMAMITNILSPLASRTIDPIHQVRAAELAQALMEEISTKAFDEQSTLVFGTGRCGDTNLPMHDCSRLNACPAGNADPGETRATFNDVDDYDCLTQSGSAIVTAQGLNMGNNIHGVSRYQGYTVAVRVGYDGDMDGTMAPALADPEIAKLITITVTTPGNQPLVFSSYRFNY